MIRKVVVVLLREKLRNTLVEKDHAGGERSYWWERIMLVGEDHVGGEEIPKNHVGAEGSCWLWKMVSFPEL